jgi:hypothetical protein
MRHPLQNIPAARKAPLLSLLLGLPVGLMVFLSRTLLREFTALSI